jgi:hypothetical protein
VERRKVKVGEEVALVGLRPGSPKKVVTGIDGRIIVGWGAARLGFQGYTVILGSSRVIP